MKMTISYTESVYNHSIATTHKPFRFNIVRYAVNPGDMAQCNRWAEAHTLKFLSGFFGRVSAQELIEEIKAKHRSTIESMAFHSNESWEERV